MVLRQVESQLHRTVKGEEGPHKQSTADRFEAPASHLQQAVLLGGSRGGGLQLRRPLLGRGFLGLGLLCALGKGSALCAGEEAGWG